MQNQSKLRAKLVILFMICILFLVLFANAYQGEAGAIWGINLATDTELADYLTTDLPKKANSIYGWEYVTFYVDSGGNLS